jgi:GT2 family glycosyltransferase
MLVDAIITCYEEDIEKVNLTLQSCILQIKAFNKIYLVDDGSKNKPIIKENLIKNNKIIFIQLPNNVGISAARNYAINLSTAEYIACINVEIVLDTFWLVKLLSKIVDNNNVCVAYSNFKTNSTDRLSNWRIRFHEQKYAPISGLSIRFAPGHAVLFKKDILVEVGGYDANLKAVKEDSDICERIVKKGKYIFYDSSVYVTSFQRDSIINLSKKQLIRSTEGRSKSMKFYNFTLIWVRDLFIRVFRNLFTLRLSFIFIDIFVFFIGFYFFLSSRIKHK